VGYFRFPPLAKHGYSCWRYHHVHAACPTPDRVEHRSPAAAPRGGGQPLLSRGGGVTLAEQLP
jgi:hypothetical protein